MGTTLQSSSRNAKYSGTIAGLYDLEDTIGRGHYAVVKLARHVFTGEKVAVKVIDKTKLDEVSKAHLFQEVRCMKLVQHPHVVRLYEVIDTQTKLYLILELADGGDLYDVIMKHDNGLEEPTAQRYFRQVVQAISYCHQLHVVHRDLKPENVVFFEKLGVVKVTDFGFSNKYRPGEKLETSCGSLAYSAPEILLGDSYDAQAIDIWSLGVVLYMLVCGKPPFQEANDSETLTKIMDAKYVVPSHVSEDCKRLINSMLQRDPDKRATLEEVASDPWLMADSAVSPFENLPLVSREQLVEEDHALILSKMVTGGIASKDEIIDALGKDEYSHITATYYLLAERKLRALQQTLPPPTPSFSTELQSSVQSGKLPLFPDGKPIQDSIQYIAPLSIPKTMESPQSTFRPAAFATLEEEAEDQLSSDGSQRGSSRSVQKVQQRSSFRSSNHSLAGTLRAKGLIPQKSMQLNLSGTNSDQEVSEIMSRSVMNTALRGSPTVSPIGTRVARSRAGSGRTTPSSVSPSSPSTPTSPSQSPTQNRNRVATRTLHSVRSSPQLVLNEIYEEENESDQENLTESMFYRTVIPSVRQRKLRLQSRPNQVVISQNLVRRFEHRKKLSKARVPSCSSSETSDDEDRKKMVEDLPDFFRRRDSRDDSSDNGSDNGKGPNLNLSSAPTVPPIAPSSDGQAAGSSGEQSRPKSGSGKENAHYARKLSEEIRVSASQSLNSLTDFDESVPRIFVRQCSNNEDENHRVHARRRSSSKTQVVEDVKSLCSKSTDCLLAESKEKHEDKPEAVQAESMLAVFRSRLHKAKSLGTLVKGNIVSHYQQEIWKRFSGVSLSVKKSHM